MSVRNIGYIELRPCRALASFVDCFWSYRHGVGGRPHRVMPDGMLDFIFDSRHLGGRLIGVMPRAIVVPQHHDQWWFGVRFKPGRARFFLDRPVAVFTGLNPAFAEIEYIAGGAALRGGDQ